MTISGYKQQQIHGSTAECFITQLCNAGTIIIGLPGSRQNDLTEQHIQHIVDASKVRKEVDNYAYVAAFEKIKENDFNLNVPSYVDTFEGKEEIDALVKELAEVRVKMMEKLNEIQR